MDCSKKHWSSTENLGAARKREEHPQRQQRADGRDHWPYCYTSVVAGAGNRRGYVHGKSDKTGSSPSEDPVHPMELLADDDYAGIDPKRSCIIT